MAEGREASGLRRENVVRLKSVMAKTPLRPNGALTNARKKESNLITLVKISSRKDPTLLPYRLSGVFALEKLYMKVTAGSLKKW